MCGSHWRQRLGLSCKGVRAIYSVQNSSDPFCRVKLDAERRSRSTDCSRAFESQNDPPPTTSRKISQPGRSHKHFEHGEHGGHREERSRQHCRHHELFCGMVFDGMTISTQDVAESKRLDEATTSRIASFAKQVTDRSNRLSPEKSDKNVPVVKCSCRIELPMTAHCPSHISETLKKLISADG